jgi:carbonic anhydrase/acetyltransferase-like protein (isoleucine patch superfamily)
MRHRGRSLVGEGKVIPPRSLVLGVPGRVVRQVTDEDVAAIQRGAKEYLELMKQLPETK